MNKKLFEKFLEKALNKFGDKFDYSKVNYEKSTDKITIICPEHGEFETTAVQFLQSKYGCKKCAIESTHAQQRWTTEIFINKAKEIWGNRFTYDKVQYINSNTKVLVTCPIHGDFLTSPKDFLKKHGCPKCKNINISKRNIDTKRDTLEIFIEKSKMLFGNLFDYSKVIYVNSRTKVLIHSNLENEDFLITPSQFLIGNIKKKYLNLPKVESDTLNNEIFIQRAKLVHGDKYDYSKVNFVNMKTKVCIICPEHGEFWQTPTNHLYNIEGCPICDNSKGELIISNVLKGLKLSYTPEYKIQINNKNLFIDFCVIINNQMVFIEYNGKQHYEPIDYFGGELRFKKQQERDELLREYCCKNEIKLLEYKYDIPLHKLSAFVKEDLKLC